MFPDFFCKSQKKYVLGPAVFAKEKVNLSVKKNVKEFCLTQSHLGLAPTFAVFGNIEVSVFLNAIAKKNWPSERGTS